MSKEATKKFVENNGFICDKCGKVIVDGIKHKNEEDLCDQCKIADLQDQLTLTEKALELACERIKYFEQQQDREMGVIEFFGQEIDYDINAFVEDYIKEAKEMMKSE